jgi:hypothetical protein
MIDRRTVLRGVGVCLALPFLESLLPRSRAGSAERPLRLAFVYAPNGKHMPDWTPTAEGAHFELPPTLRPLEPVREYVSVLSGLCLRPASADGDGPGDHARAMAAFLTGVRPQKTSGADVRAGISVDQLAAAHLGRQTRLPSLEVGCEGGKPAGTCDGGYSCAYQTNLSWRTPTLPLPKEVNPRLVFDRLFGEPNRPETDQARRDRDRRSLLDFVAEDARHLAPRLAGDDRRKLDEYLTGVREVEQRIQRAAATCRALNEQRASGKEPFSRPAGIPENYVEHARLLADLIVLAFQADLTRVATFVLGNDGSNRAYREADVAKGHHDVSHHGNNPANLDRLRRINRLHVEQLAHLLGKLRATPDGDASLLDRCLIVYGSGIRDGDRHDHDDLPILLAGRGEAVPAGRHIRYPAGTPLCNLHRGLLARVGVSVERFGDSTGVVLGGGK